MAGSARFHFVDVFAERPLQGNPVVLVEPADDLDDATMKALAREFNQSETTFVLTPTNARATVRLRSFTPNGSEVFGAGHNVLGAWLWWAGSGRLPAAEAVELRQQIGDELLPVRLSLSHGGRVTVSMTQSPPVFGRSVPNLSTLADALGVGQDELSSDLTPQVVSTGAGHLLVALADRSVVDRVAPDVPKLAAVLLQAQGEGCYVYSRDPGRSL